MDLSYIVTTFLRVGAGLGTTLKLFFITILASLPLGFLITMMMRSGIAPLRWLSKSFVYLMRSTPLVLQLLFIYFGLPYLPYIGHWFSQMGRFTATIWGFVLNYAAYFAEIFRGGLQSIPRGQREAGKALGFSRVQIFFRILLPQLFKRSLLPVSNEVVTLVKDTALVTCIALCDMYYYAKKATSATGSLLPLFLAGAFYLLMNTVVEVVFDRLNKRMDYYRG